MLTQPYWVFDELEDATYCDKLDASSVTEVYQAVVSNMLPFEPRDSKEQILNSLLSAEYNRTFSLGNGIAIPHLSWERPHCRAGWFVLTDGVIFPGSGTIRLVFCAFADEHRLAPLMAKACEILTWEGLVRQIMGGDSGEALLRYVRNGIGTVKDRFWRELEASGDAMCAEVTVVNRRGLHARAAARLASLIEQFDSVFIVETKEMRIDVKEDWSGLMMLGASRGTVLELRAIGSDAIDALIAASALIENGFDEVD